MLAVEGVSVHYGKALALDDVSLDVRDGEIVSLVGRNGAGKSTVMKTVIGLLRCTRGRCLLDARDVTALGPHRRSRLGIAYVPEDRQIFANLTVDENLALAEYIERPGQWTRRDVYALFPQLAERASSGGSTLSGGEQQMLAIGRAVLMNPRLILLDEPTEGLAPMLVETVAEAIRRINRQGVSVLLVEQNLKVPLALAARQYVIDHGTIVWSGTTAELLAARAAVERYVSV